MSRQITVLGKVVLAALVFALPVCASASQTDAALSVYGAFSGTTTGAGQSINTQTPANAAGGMIELRHLVHPWLGYEATYSFNRANQNYTNEPVLSCPISLGNCSEIIRSSISANAHEITGDWVFSLKLLNLHPFAVVGAGVLIDVPTWGSYAVDYPSSGSLFSSSPATSTAVKPVFVYGAGFDWGLLPHLGLRFQYRGNVSKAAALTNAIQSTNAFMNTSEPMIGAYFRF